MEVVKFSVEDVVLASGADLKNGSWMTDDYFKDPADGTSENPYGN